jgi:hypothetical protein
VSFLPLAHLGERRLRRVDPYSARPERPARDRGRLPAVSRAAEEQNRSLARARNAMVRTHAEPLYVPAPVRIACVSEER